MLERFRRGLDRTRQGLTDKVRALVSAHRAVDEELYEALEEILLGADVGVATTRELLGRVRDGMRRGQDSAAVLPALGQEVRALLGPDEALREDPGGLLVVLVVGVNGGGKTTTCGKLAWRYRRQGKGVVLAAADTFRAAAAEQLSLWGERTGATVIRGQDGSDPAAVAYDAVRAARARGADVLLVDTAGRLHTKVNLMEELKKIRRVLAREDAAFPQEVLLVLDAAVGQNGLQQARLFREAVGVTGVVLTKLDGTARGGVVLAVRRELGLPVKLVGLGEGPEDLQDFRGDDFTAALFGRSAT